MVTKIQQHTFRIAVPIVVTGRERTVLPIKEAFGLLWRISDSQAVRLASIG